MVLILIKLIRKIIIRLVAINNALDSCRAYTAEGIVEALLNEGADPNEPDNKGDYPLNVAVNVRYECSDLLRDHNLKIFSRRQLSIVIALLNQGADPNKPDNKGNYPLNIALSRGLDDVVMVLLKSGTSPHTEISHIDEEYYSN
jgi:ankyrin repeat protein